MSNYLKAKEELLIYIKARTPFVVIESSERERVERMLTEIAYENNISIDYYTDSKQLTVMGGTRPSEENINHDPLQYGFNKFYEWTLQKINGKAKAYYFEDKRFM